MTFSQKNTTTLWDRPLRINGPIWYKAGMNLHDHLIETGQTESQFGERIGTSQSAVSKYRRGTRVPRPKIMAAIIRETEGKVTANDFVNSKEE